MPADLTREDANIWRAGVLDIPHFASYTLGVMLHEGQRFWLANSTKRVNILVTGNRWGKSFIWAVKLLHHAIYRVRKLKCDSAGRYRA